MLLGIAGSAQSSGAVAAAFEEASLRGAPLLALHAMPPDRHQPGAVRPPAGDPSLRRAEGELVLAEALAGWAQKYPDVPVRREVTFRPPAAALIDAADRACLVVVGRRDCGGLSSLTLGSVSQALVHRAGCPVLVAHEPTPTE